jgi:hypothetical protein
MNELDLLRQFGLLTPADEQKAREQSIYASLGGLAQALMAPRQRGQSALAQFGQAALQGYQAGEQSFDQTLQGILKRTQLQDLLRQRQEQEMAKRRQAQIQQMIPSLYRERMGQVPTILPGETGDIETTVPGVVGRQLDPERLRMLGMLGPEGMQAATQLAQFERSMTPERKTVTAKPGEQIVDPTTGQVIYQAPFETKQVDRYRLLTTDEVKQQGLPAGNYQVNESTGKISPVGSSPLVQVGGELSPFGKAVSQKQADVFSKISETSQNARRSLADIDRLNNLFNQFQSGGGAAFKQFAGNFGIDTKNLSEIQAAEAIISRLVPQQRPPNSGTMSDADLAEFKKSLPRIINRPGANQIIIKTLRDIANYQIQEGQIADMVMDQEISPAEGRKRLRELVNPIDTFFAGGVYQQYNLEPRKR